jgi:hypothetical protein
MQTFRLLLADVRRIAARWLLWSPRRLLAVCGGLVVLVLVLGALHHPKHPANQLYVQPSTAPLIVVTETTEPSATATGSVSPTHSSRPATPPPASTIQVSVATRFVAAWVDHGKPVARWLAGIQPVATARLMAALDQADPSNVPANKVTGPGRVGVAGDGQVQVLVPTDTYTAVVTLQREQQRGWLVDQIDVA